MIHSYWCHGAGFFLSFVGFDASRFRKTDGMSFISTQKKGKDLEETDLVSWAGDEVKQRSRRIGIWEAPIVDILSSTIKHEPAGRHGDCKGRGEGISPCRRFVHLVAMFVELMPRFHHDSARAKLSTAGIIHGIRPSSKSFMWYYMNGV